MADALDVRLQIANAVTLADELLALHLEGETVPVHKAHGRLLKLELEAVLRHAREFAGLNPGDGKFDQVPRPRPPAPKARKP